MTAKVELLTPSGGKVILDPTDTAVDRTLTLPAVAGTVVNNTTLRTELNATGLAPIFACRAFVKFNGTGTPVINGSGNVASITKLSTGDYRINLSTAMPTDQYSVSISSILAVNNNDAQDQVRSINVGAFEIRHQEGATVVDTSLMCAAIFG